MGGEKSLRVLVIDDDKDILDLLDYNLRKEGFRVKIIEDSRCAIEEATRFKPHLIILDIMMPHASGFDILKDLRAKAKFKDVYIFFLTALSDQHYQQQAYRTGADDYIEKIIGLRSLTHKVKTVLQNNYVIRKRVLNLQAGRLLLERQSCSATLEDRRINLSPPEFELLFFLAQNPNKSISQKSLIHNIWGSETYLHDPGIDNYMHSLQKKLGPLFIDRGDNRYKFVG
jgi:two-component system, OmpR family, alkaline phosphatase synthesis response regulator PhoP